MVLKLIGDNLVKLGFGFVCNDPPGPNTNQALAMPPLPDEPLETLQDRLDDHDHVDDHDHAAGELLEVHLLQDHLDLLCHVSLLSNLAGQLT